MKKEIVIIVISIIVIIIVFLVFVYPPMKKNKAIKLANEYVETFIADEVEFIGFRSVAFVDPQLYYVQYKPKNNQDFEFSVYMLKNFSRINDDYFENYFSYQINEHYSKIVEDIWGNNAIFSASATVNNLSVRDNLELDQHMEKDLSRNYATIQFIWVDADYVLTLKNVDDEADRILRFLQELKSDGYLIHQLDFNYNNQNNKDSGIQKISISKWKEIENIENVKELLKKSLFD